MRWMLAVALGVGLLGVTTASAGGAQERQLTASQVKTLLLKRAVSTNRPAQTGYATNTFSDVPTPCGRPTGVLCATVTVPLDRTGVFPGSVALHVEELPATGTPRGVIFLIAGGPGQGSAHGYGLGDETAVSPYRFLFPGSTLVAYYVRGTPDSRLLDCPAVRNAI